MTTESNNETPDLALDARREQTLDLAPDARRDNETPNPATEAERVVNPNTATEADERENPNPAIVAADGSNVVVEDHYIYDNNDILTEGYEEEEEEEYLNGGTITPRFPGTAGIPRPEPPRIQTTSATSALSRPSMSTGGEMKRKRERKRKRSPSTSSSSSSSSDSSDSSSDERRKRRKKNKKSKKRSKRSKKSPSSPSSKFFKVIKKQDRHAWGMRKDMARHVNKHSRQFIPEKDVQEQILDIHPVPTNINKPPELDPVLETMLKTRYKNECIKKDENLKRTQVKIRDALGPLSKVWSLMEDLKHNNEIKKFMDTQEVGEAIEQTNLLLGQA